MTAPLKSSPPHPFGVELANNLAFQADGSDADPLCSTVEPVPPGLQEKMTTFKSSNEEEHVGRDEPSFRVSPLEPNDHLYRLLIESVADYAIFVLDTTGHIRSWNPGAQRLKG